MAMKFPKNNPGIPLPGKATSENYNTQAGSEAFQIPRVVSIEAEYCSYGKLSSVEPWITTQPNWVHDGSVNNTQQELVFSGLAGSSIPETMIELAGKAALYKFQVDASCGLHTHIDCRDWNWRNLVRFLTGYLAMEKWVYKLLPPARRTCKYARPLISHPKVKVLKEIIQKPQEEYARELVQALVGLELPANAREWNPWLLEKWEEWKATKPRNFAANPTHPRYYGLNLHSFFYRGTIEWRHAESTCDVWKLVWWPAFTLQVTHVLGEARLKDFTAIAANPAEWIAGNCTKLVIDGLARTMEERLQDKPTKKATTKRVTAPAAPAEQTTRLNPITPQTRLPAPAAPDDNWRVALQRMRAAANNPPVWNDTTARAIIDRQNAFVNATFADAENNLDFFLTDGITNPPERDRVTPEITDEPTF